MKNRYLLLLASLVTTASAQDALDAIKPFTATKLTAYASTDMDFKNGAGELDAYSIDFRTLVSKPLEFGDDYKLFAMFHYEATFLRYDRTPIGFPVQDEDLHTFQLPVYLVHYGKQSPWIYGAFVTPGLSTNFGHVDTDDIFIDAGVGAGYRFSDTLMVGAGVGVYDITGDPSFLPGLGLLWKPTECVSVELLGPTFSATYYAGSDWRFGFDVRSAGGRWNIDDNHQSRTLNLRSMRAGLSAQRRVYDTWWVEVGGGITFANRVDLTTHGGLGLNEADLKRLDEGPYGYVSFKKEFW